MGPATQWLLLALCSGVAAASPADAAFDSFMLSELPELNNDIGNGANGWSILGRQDGDRIAEGETVRLHIRGTPGDVLYIAFCSSQCGNLQIYGVNRGKVLFQYERDVLPSIYYPLASDYFNDPTLLFSNNIEYVFGVARRSGRILVWLDGHPEDAAVVQMDNSDQDSLRIQYDGVWSFSRQSFLSPILPVIKGSRLCVDLEYTAYQTGVELFTKLESGLNATVWKAIDSHTVRKPDRKTVQVLVAHPEVGDTWQLGVSCPDCNVHKIGSCNTAAANIALSSMRRELLAAKPAGHVCSNGGRLLGTGGCACPPGFTGPSCELGCGPGRGGAGCSERCGRGELLCVAGLGCLCAAGYGGDTCDTPCLGGRYGASCLQRCGHCKGGVDCDPYTGQCSQGCSSGYSGSTCKEELAHLMEGPNITHTEDSLIHVSLLVTDENTVGKGEVQFVRVQFRESTSRDWTTFSTLQLVRGTELTFTIDSLLSSTQYDVRALLLDSHLNAFKPEVTPYTRVQTSGQRMLSNFKVTNSEARSLEVTWESAFNNTDYIIRYTCVNQLTCPAEQCGSSSGQVAPAHNMSARLTQLQPAATYIVEAVSDQAVWASVLLDTKTEASQSVVELPPNPVSVTNSSALIHWLPPSTCSRLYGPVRDYPWELVETSAPAAVLRSNRTARPQLSLQGLRPYTNYTLRVHVANPLGHNASVFLPINFTTLPSLPSAPRDLVAYRWSRKSVWLSWLSSEQPGGELVRYDVSAATSSHQVAQQAAAGAECSAWPGRVCHALHGLLPGAKYTFTVRAVNRYSDQPGQPATVTAGTRIGSQGQISQAPVNLRVVDANSTSITVQWSLPPVIGSDFGMFVLYVQDLIPLSEEDGERIDQIEMSDNEEKPWYRYTLTDLRPKASYNIAVKLGFKGVMAEVLGETTD